APDVCQSAYRFRIFRMHVHSGGCGGYVGCDAWEIKFCCSHVSLPSHWSPAFRRLLSAHWNRHASFFSIYRNRLVTDSARDKCYCVPPIPGVSCAPDCKLLLLVEGLVLTA